MKCRTAKKLTFKLLDGLADDAKRLELEQHLAECSDCDQFAAHLTRSLDLLHRAPVEKTSDNFAWKVKLKLNQERNAAGARSGSYGAFARTWNLRYAAAAAAAVAVVVLGGWFLIDNGFAPFPSGGGGTVELAAGQRTEATTPSPQRASAGDVDTRLETGDDAGRRSDAAHPPKPDFGYSVLTQPVGAGAYSTRGRIIGVDDLIDRTGPMSVAQIDSLVHTQLDYLSADEQVRYLSQYLVLLQRHLLQAHMRRHANQ